MQTSECQIKTMERSDFRPWTLEIPELFYAAVAARLLQGSRCFPCWILDIQSFHGQEGLSLQ
jgi:hypothetical protein